jgi:hypothetical protein
MPSVGTRTAPSERFFTELDLPSRTLSCRYDEEAVFKILDEGVVAHVSFQLPVDPDGLAKDDWPHPPIPMAYGRIGSTLYLHGYINSQLLKALSEDDVKVVLTVSTVQGYVIALNPVSSLALRESYWNLTPFSIIMTSMRAFLSFESLQELTLFSFAPSPSSDMRNIARAKNRSRA